MAEKEDSVIRFSELIRKGTSKKEPPEKEKEHPTEEGEDVAFRMSDLDSLSLRGKPVTPAVSKQGIPPPRSEREIERERRGRSSEGFYLKDIDRTRTLGGKDASAGDDVTHKRNSDLDGVWKEGRGGVGRSVDRQTPSAEPFYPSERARDKSVSERSSGRDRRSGDIPLREKGESGAEKGITASADRPVESERAALQEGLRSSHVARLQNEREAPSEQEAPVAMWRDRGVFKREQEGKDVETIETPESMPGIALPKSNQETVLEEATPDEKGVAKAQETVESDASSKPEEAVPPKQEAGSIDGVPEDEERIYLEAINYLQAIKKKIVDGKSFEIETALGIIAKMVESNERIQNLCPLTMRTMHEEDYNISHQVNVMIYALKLGFGLKYSKAKLIELGLAALLHDVGMFRIPESISLKTGQLTGREIDVIKTHPEIGREILKPFSGRYPFLPEVAYEHHEREEGQGYPQGLRGNEIHEYAKILSLVDSYEAMTHNRPYRKALMQSFSAKELIKQKNALFAPFVIKVFLQEISLYPLGSYVMLNSKAVAEVVASDQRHPLRPDVKILYDGEGSKVYDNVIIKLSQNPLFFIVDGVSPDEIPKR